MERSCSACKFSVANPCFVEVDFPVFECRRFPPHFDTTGYGFRLRVPGQFPIVGARWWCGEFSPIEGANQEPSAAGEPAA